MLIIQYIIEDLREVLEYVPAGLLAGILYFALRQGAACRRLGWRGAFGARNRSGADEGEGKGKGKGKGKGAAAHTCQNAREALFTAYLIILLQVAFFSREPGSRIGVDLTLFGTWGSSARAHSYVVENVIMFLPFGFLLPFGVRLGMREKTMAANFFTCVLAGFLFSTALELIQLVTGRGYCQLDDVVMNTLGTAIGWMMWRSGWGKRQKDIHDL